MRSTFCKNGKGISEATADRIDCKVGYNQPDSTRTPSSIDTSVLAFTCENTLSQPPGFSKTAEVLDKWKSRSGGGSDNFRGQMMHV